MSDSVIQVAPLSVVAARFLARAQAAVAAGDLQAARLTMDSVAALAPNHPEALRWTGIVAQHLQDHGTAAANYRHALEALPDDAELHTGLGVELAQLGRVSEGLVHLKRGCELAPDSATAWYNLAQVLQVHGEVEPAIEALQRTLMLDPDHTLAQLALAHVRASRGEIDTAAAALRALLQREPGLVDAWLALANLKTLNFNGDDVRQLEAGLAQPDLPAEDRARLDFVLAHALEDQGDYAKAWLVLQRANAAQRRFTPWDAAGEHRRVDAVLSAFAAPIAVAGDPQLGHAVIFVASLPRSGSTLVEQILASHPQVEGANEIKDVKVVVDAETARRHSAFPLWVPDASAADWQRLGEQYLARTSRWRAHRPRMTDKNLLNWLTAGTLLSMLPGSRVIIVRRDPVETCLGCYRQWFSGTAGYSYDLDEMADVYIDFWRVTRVWLDKFPDAVFELKYETLVADPEPTVRGLLAFCGLPFDPACLEFYKTERTVLSAPSAAQVRQPLHNTARASRYGHALDGLRLRLHDAGLPVEAP
ncbi:MAG TPA: sulfotransferase [Rhodanobacteraceae bacterium]